MNIMKEILIFCHNIVLGTIYDHHGILFLKAWHVARLAQSIHKSDNLIHILHIITLCIRLTYITLHYILGCVLKTIFPKINRGYIAVSSCEEYKYKVKF